MAQPTTTRKEIRQRIGMLLQEPFFARIGASSGACQAGTTTTVIEVAASLAQEDNFWRNSWILITSGTAIGEVRRIESSNQVSSNLTLETALGATPNTNDTFEIWSTFNPYMIHETINWGLRRAWPNFFRTVEDFMVIRELLGNRYSLQSLLTVTPRFLHQVWHERPASSITGTVTAATSTTLSDSTNSPFVDGLHDDGGWEVRIYQGTGAGERKTISAVNSTSQITVDSAWGTNPDTTSKYRLVRIGDGLMSYEFFNTWQTDAPEWPTLWIPNGHPYGFEGYAWRLIYTAVFDDLSDDTTTTLCPEDYLVLFVLSQLYTLKQAQSPSSESRNWAILQTQASQQLEQYIEENRYNFPDTTMLAHGAPTRRYAADYPFRPN